jgi:regulator of replication initiation timing
MQTSEKEQFKNYLKKSGIIDVLTKVLASLYEEQDRPKDAIEFLKRHVGAVIGVDIEALQRENNELKLKVKELTKRIEELQQLKATANTNSTNNATTTSDYGSGHGEKSVAEITPSSGPVASSEPPIEKSAEKNEK